MAIYSGLLIVCYWKWPSRNSGFTQKKMVDLSHQFFVCLPEGKSLGPTARKPLYNFDLVPQTWKYVDPYPLTCGCSGETSNEIRFFFVKRRCFASTNMRIMGTCYQQICDQNFMYIIMFTRKIPLYKHHNHIIFGGFLKWRVPLNHPF